MQNRTQVNIALIGARINKIRYKNIALIKNEITVDVFITSLPTVK
jgi:hypothetical protein